MNKKSIILKLFFTSSSFVLKIAFFALPIALFFAINSYLFIDNILKSYKNYLIESYIGSSGRFSVQTTNQKFIQAISLYAKKQNIPFSKKLQLTSNIIFISPNKNIVKYANLIVLDKNYLQKKFNTQSTIFINKVMANSFGSIDISKFTSLTIDKKSFLKINNIKVIDTGFLLNTPTIFISFEQFDKIYHKKTKINFIEFLETDDKTINTLKHDIKQLSKKLNILQYHTKDILLDTKEIKEFFNRINLIRVLISFFMLLLSLGVVIVAIAIAIEFKKHSLKIIHTIGVSKNDIGSTLGGIVFIMMIVSLILAIGFVFIQREIFIKILDFNQNFFVSLSIFEVLNIFILSILFFFIIKYISKIIFKEQK